MKQVYKVVYDGKLGGMVLPERICPGTKEEKYKIQAMEKGVVVVKNKNGTYSVYISLSAMYTSGFDKETDRTDIIRSNIAKIAVWNKMMEEYNAK